MKNSTMRCAFIWGLYFAGIGLITFESAAGDEIVICADKDNTLFENTTGALSNAAGSFFFSGQTGFSTTLIF